MPHHHTLTNGQRATAGLLAVGLTWLALAGAASAQTVQQHTDGPKARVIAITGGLPPPPPTPPSAPAGH
jgi:hypothetical protein